MIRSYRSRPVVVRAVRWTGRNVGEMRRFAGGSVFVDNGDLYIRTLEGRLLANRGDWIIEGLVGDFYPCKPGVFKRKYDLVENEQP